MHVHDIHATILHLMGLDHEQLTYRYAGRDFRLTDVSGRVVDEILARRRRGHNVDETIWDAAPPVDGLYEMAVEGKRWANISMDSVE